MYGRVGIKSRECRRHGKADMKLDNSCQLSCRNSTVGGGRPADDRAEQDDLSAAGIVGSMGLGAAAQFRMLINYAVKIDGRLGGADSHIYSRNTIRGRLGHLLASPGSTQRPGAFPSFFVARKGGIPLFEENVSPASFCTKTITIVMIFQTFKCRDAFVAKASHRCPRRPSKH